MGHHLVGVFTFFNKIDLRVRFTQGMDGNGGMGVAGIIMNI